MNCLRVISFYRSKSLPFRSLSVCLAARKNIFSDCRPVTVAVRFFHDFEVNSRVQDHYRKVDKLGKNFEIIYRAPMLNYLKFGHYITFFCAIAAPLMTLLYMAGDGTFVFPIYLGKYPLMRSYFDFIGFYAGLYLIGFQMYAVIVRYPLRVYTDRKGNYIAVYRALLPWNLKNEAFKGGELKKINSYMPWGDSLYAFKSKKAIFLEEYFNKPVDLNEMIQPSPIKEKKK